MDVQTLLATWMEALVNWLPVGYAFGAGMVSTVNPCGFAMLPAYLALYLGTAEPGFYERSTLRRSLRAGWIAGVMSAGFVVLFGAIGVLLSLGGRTVTQSMPWIGLAVGIALVLLGVWLFSGRSLSAGLFHRLAERIGDPRTVSTGGFFLYGIAFGAASLSCTLPIFLTVIGSAFATGGLLASMAQFVAYALGMGAVVLALTLAAALVKEGLLVRRVRRLMPYIQPASATLLVVAGVYIVYYWLVIGRLIDVLI